MGSALGTVTSQDLTQSGAFAPFQNLNWKRISNLRHASYFHLQPPCIGRLRDPKKSGHPNVNRAETDRLYTSRPASRDLREPIKEPNYFSYEAETDGL